MIDIEKVIKGLELCKIGRCDSRCPYNNINVGCKKQLADDTLALLKEQEPIPVEIHGKIFDTKFGDCPHCGERLNSEVYPHWCGFCGQAVKWDE